MNKRIRTGLISTALVAGSLFGASAVSAQADDTVTPDTVIEQPADVDNADSETGDRGPRGDRQERGDHGDRGPRGDRGDRAQATADLLGIDVEDLQAAFQQGQTLAQIAEANGVDVQTIIDAKVAAKTEHINAAVEAGRLTAAEADEKLANLEAQVTTRVNEGGPVRGADSEHPIRGADGERPARGERGERPARGGAPAADQDA
tara:strand:+ start:835 stop:1446 length:612 start_codon:yes stop_codon:yes gene_type:complete